ncbi:hypothetical protein HHK36_000584 [Tetracentron sinense]|uniref:Uncharacterized protein n=1 Tax=Tetracentron sinense TaxID=13715 RepID=A0A834ZW48_TETSI|nr:hypothetical protein HHK36_000584 [Tetracentron sinense]
MLPSIKTRSQAFQLRSSAYLLFNHLQKIHPMAASAAKQSVFASPITRVTHRTKAMHGSSFYLGATSAKNTSMQVMRCMAKQPLQEETTPGTPPTLDNSTKFSNVLAFSGPAPERINGRLAMIGFVAAIAVELSKGEDLFTQLANGGILWFVGTSIVLSVASLIPLLKGISVQSKSEGVMTSDAEMWNGRFAMLGLVALAFTEYMTGGTLV